jgi:hypothetical protein
MITLPTVYGLVLSQQPPAHEMLLLARLNGVSAEAPPAGDTMPASDFPARCQRCRPGHGCQCDATPAALRREQLAQLFAGFDDPCVLMHGNLRLASMLKDPHSEDSPAWTTALPPAGDTMPASDFPARCQRCRPGHGFDDPCVLMHGNLRLASMLKDPHSDQLVAMTQPGTMVNPGGDR